MKPTLHLKAIVNDEIAPDTVAPADIQDMTLNGYKLSDAINMRNYFRNANTQTPQHGSVYFSRDVFARMIQLLDDEGIADGIRIYFARTGNKPADKTTILLVSTVDDGYDPNASGIRKHKDYFKHDISKPLYTAASSPGKDYLFGDITVGKGDINDATLYDMHYHGPTMGTDHCRHGDPHYIEFSDARDMVNAFDDPIYVEITTRAVWFDITYLRELNKEAAHGGIRVYFARETRPNDDNGLETFVIVTTEKSSRGTQADYHDCRGSRMSTSPPIPSLKRMMDMQGLTRQDMRNLLLDGDDENGEICPTHCDCTSPLMDPSECPPLSAPKVRQI